MLLSLAIIFLVGLSAAAIFERIGLPRIIGMLGVGIVTSPYVLNLLDPKILGISSELRQIALIIILIKSGISLNLSDLKKVGSPAVFMSFVPACCEIIGYVAWSRMYRSHCHGGGAECGVSCGGRTKNGKAHRRKMGYREEHTPDDTCRSLLR